MSPTCQSGVELLMDYLEGVLAPDVHAALGQHVSGCARCSAFVASYLDTTRVVRDVTAVTLPEDRQAALQDFLRSRTDAFRRR